MKLFICKIYDWIHCRLQALSVIFFIVLHHVMLTIRYIEYCEFSIKYVCKIKSFQSSILLTSVVSLLATVWVIIVDNHNVKRYTCI